MGFPLTYADDEIAEGEVLFEARRVTKAYPGVVALDDVSIAFYAGEVHALVGENGAGKSTLIKMMSGFEVPDSGILCMAGEELASFTPASAIAHGIGTIYQDAMLVPDLTVAENIFLGAFPGKGALVNRKELKRCAAAVLESLDVSVDPSATVAQLGATEAQFVAIAKAVATDARLIIMDEPTAALTDADADKLFGLVGRLKAQGKAIVYITHRLTEVFRLADRITILRDGRVVGQGAPSDLTRDELVGLIVGRPLEKVYPERSSNRGEKKLAVKGLSGAGVHDVSFEVHAGEILGIAGLVGSGLDCLGRMLFGAAPSSAGEVLIDGERVRFGSPAEAVSHGVGYVPADRKAHSVLLERTVRENISLASVRRLAHGGILDLKRERGLVSHFIDGLKIKTPGMDQPVGNLSGGNQQKVALSKWLATSPAVLIMDEPTQGIDVGARHEIYRLMRSLAAEGVSIIALSSDMEELMGMADRILVMHDGGVAGMLDSPDKYSQEAIMGYASGLVA